MGEVTNSHPRDRPDRADGRDWTHTQIRAAQCRAKCRTWPETADEIGIKVGSAKHYPSKYPNFTHLVDYYRDQIFFEEVTEALRERGGLAIRAAAEAVEVALEEVRREQQGDGPVDPQRLRALARTIKTLADVSGRATFQRQISKLRANDAETGSASDKVTVDSGTQLAELLGLDVDQLDDDDG